MVFGCAECCIAVALRLAIFSVGHFLAAPGGSGVGLTLTGRGDDWLVRASPREERGRRGSARMSLDNDQAGMVGRLRRVSSYYPAIPAAAGNDD